MTHGFNAIFTLEAFGLGKTLFLEPCLELAKQNLTGFFFFLALLLHAVQSTEPRKIWSGLISGNEYRKECNVKLERKKPIEKEAF